MKPVITNVTNAVAEEVRYEINCRIDYIRMNLWPPDIFVRLPPSLIDAIFEQILREPT